MGSLGEHLFASTASLLNGKTAPSFGGSGTASLPICDIYTSVGVRNAAAWWGSLDLTSISRIGPMRGIAITPKHMIVSSHVVDNQIGASGTAVFDDNAGQAYTRTCTTMARFDDVMICSLDSPLPDGISPAKVLSESDEVHLKFSGHTYPCVFTNQDRKLLVADLLSTSETSSIFYRSPEPYRQPWSYPVRPGDSGSPVGLIVNNAFVLLGLIWRAQRIPRTSMFIPQLNAVIASSGHSVSTINLGSFSVPW